jgi:hypothetical protein
MFAISDPTDILGDDVLGSGAVSRAGNKITFDSKTR